MRERWLARSLGHRGHDHAIGDRDGFRVEADRPRKLGRDEAAFPESTFDSVAQTMVDVQNGGLGVGPDQQREIEGREQDFWVPN